jgi:hypothetical protein
MHFGKMESLGHTFAWKLGLYPSILAQLSSITSNFQNWWYRTIELPGVLVLPSALTHLSSITVLLISKSMYLI